MCTQYFLVCELVYTYILYAYILYAADRGCDEGVVVAKVWP